MIATTKPGEVNIYKEYVDGNNVTEKELVAVFKSRNDANLFMMALFEEVEKYKMEDGGCGE